VSKETYYAGPGARPPPPPLRCVLFPFSWNLCSHIYDNRQWVGFSRLFLHLRVLKGLTHFSMHTLCTLYAHSMHSIPRAHTPGYAHTHRTCARRMLARAHPLTLSLSLSFSLSLSLPPSKRHLTMTFLTFPPYPNSPLPSSLSPAPAPALLHNFISYRYLNVQIEFR
jgi:hypothetical protein